MATNELELLSTMLRAHWHIIKQWYYVCHSKFSSFFLPFIHILADEKNFFSLLQMWHYDNLSFKNSQNMKKASMYNFIQCFCIFSWFKLNWDNYFKIFSFMVLFQENDYLVSHFDDDEDGLMDDDDMDEGPIYWVTCLLSEFKDKQGNVICPHITVQLITKVYPSDNSVKIKDSHKPHLTEGRSTVTLVCCMFWRKKCYWFHVVAILVSKICTCSFFFTSMRLSLCKLYIISSIEKDHLCILRTDFFSTFWNHVAYQ